MQIRIGNKQDEASIRELVAASYSQSARTLALDGGDSDLRNIEKNYIWHDGVFLVAEDEREVIGFAAALKKTDTVLLLKRLVVAEISLRPNISQLLLKQVLKFAKDLDYLAIDFIVDESNTQLICLLKDHGFKGNEDSSVFELALR